MLALSAALDRSHAPANNRVSRIDAHYSVLQEHRIHCAHFALRLHINLNRPEFREESGPPKRSFSDTSRKLDGSRGTPRVAVLQNSCSESVFRGHRLWTGARRACEGQ